jgi:hypothetical protein
MGSHNVYAGYGFRLLGTLSLADWKEEELSDEASDEAFLGIFSAQELSKPLA